MKSRWLFLMLTVVAGVPALAVGGPDAGRRLYASCAGCHGTAGNATLPNVPALAGQSSEALLASLRAFKAGTRSATIMQQVAKGYSDEQLVLIAAYLAARGNAPPAQKGNKP
jgi:cytochrome c553